MEKRHAHTGLRECTWKVQNRSIGANSEESPSETRFAGASEPNMAEEGSGRVVVDSGEDEESVGRFILDPT